MCVTGGFSQIWSHISNMYNTYRQCVFYVYYQIAAAVQSHMSDYMKGDIPSYKLYLHLGDIVKLSVNIPQEYVMLRMYTNYIIVTV